jgi:hypothetical protein
VRSWRSAGPVFAVSERRGRHVPRPLLNSGCRIDFVCRHTGPGCDIPKIFRSLSRPGAAGLSHAFLKNLVLCWALPRQSGPPRPPRPPRWFGAQMFAGGERRESPDLRKWVPVGKIRSRTELVGRAAGVISQRPPLCCTGTEHDRWRPGRRMQRCCHTRSRMVRPGQCGGILAAHDLVARFRVANDAGTEK